MCYVDFTQRVGQCVIAAITNAFPQLHSSQLCHARTPRRPPPILTPPPNPCPPAGLAFDPRLDALYVADTENHALRLVLLSSGTVTTLLGDGTQGRDYLGGAAGRAQRLNSPWEVILAPAGPAGGAEGEARVFVAMAGSHQLWEYEPGSGVGRVFSGDGYERNRNGPNGPNTSYAQVGVAADITK